MLSHKTEWTRGHGGIKVVTLLAVLWLAHVIMVHENQHASLHARLA